MKSRTVALLAGTAVLSSVGAVWATVDAGKAPPEKVLSSPLSEEYVGPNWSVKRFDNGTSVFRFEQDLKQIAAGEASAASRSTTYSTFKVAGTKVAEGGCQLSGNIEAGPGLVEAVETEDLVWVQREVILDETGCSSNLEGAWVTRLGAEEAGFHLESGEVAETAKGWLPSGPGAAARALAWSWDGRIKGYVEDVAQVDVTSATARVQWSGSSCSTISHAWTSYWGWLILSGWTDVERWGTSSTSNGGCWNRSTHGKYKNGVFCFTNDTWTNSDVFFQAKPGGGSWASWNVTRWGGCSWALNAQHYYDPN